MNKVKIFLTSGAILYRGDNETAFRAYINASNARGASVITAYLDEAMTKDVQLVLSNVEYFHKI